mgnify:FL=1
MIDFANKRVLFIDLDGTLIKTISGKKFPEDITDFRIQLPVLNKIVGKLPNLELVRIITNQGGIGKFFTEEDFDTKISSISAFCYNYLGVRYKASIHGFGWDYCASTDKTDPKRKPNIGMLEEYYNQCTIKDKTQYIMIGDASGKPGDFSDSDKKCAENFGIDYIDVRDFLNL